jgi:hypothetical protein
VIYVVPARAPIAVQTDPDEDPLEAVMADRVEVLSAYGRTVHAVERMVDDDALNARVERRGLHLVNVAWEDTGRAVGSSIGPNISDLTLLVRRREGAAGYRDALMPVIRPPNFTDHSGDVPADRFFVRVGNERGGPLSTVPLTELLRDPGRFLASPASVAGLDGGPLDLSAARDTHFLVSAQAVFLPVPRAGKAEFNPVIFNYQSAPGSPAVLAILATREGTSVTVIDNRTDDLTSRGWGQELYFDEGGHRAAFTAERRTDVEARISAQGGTRTEADRSALGHGADVMALVQVPLVHQDRGLLGGMGTKSGADSGYSYEFSNDPLSPTVPRPAAGGRLLERAVLGHGPRLGPFVEGRGTRLVRDTRFPVRITVQFYKATSDGAVTERDLDAIARSISSAYEHADYVGSLVVPEGDRARPTAWQRVPGDWFPF